MTRLRCPSCGDEMSLAILIAHNELRQAMVDLVEKSLSLGSLVLRYVGLFRPATNRMSPDRFAKLVLQLTPDLQRNAITYRGRDWPISLPAWQQGFEAILEKVAADKLVLPLENHNYLYAVLAGLADKVEAVAEAQVEQQRQVVARTATASAPVAIADLVDKPGMPAHIREQAEAIRQRARTEGLGGAHA